jgi:hypothetical protein
MSDQPQVAPVSVSLDEVRARALQMRDENAVVGSDVIAAVIGSIVMDVLDTPVLRDKVISPAVVYCAEA